MNTVELRKILENIQAPHKLDSHPWVSARFVLDLARDFQGSPGEKLIHAVSAVFRETMPGIPPRRGIRLDTRWAEFGLLAAQYFAPAKFGVVAPGSLRNAWAHIDRAILFFVYGRADELTQAQFEPYILIGRESGVAPDSTLSDWHRKGIEQLTHAIQVREQYLSRQVEDASLASSPKKKPRKVRRWIALGILGLFLILATLGVIKALHVYGLARVVVDDIYKLQDVSKTPSIDKLKNAGALLSKTRQDFSALREEVGPFLWMTSLLGWVPTYGGDMISAPALIEMADSMLTSADMTYQAGAPLLDDVLDSSGEISFDPPRLLNLLNQIAPQMNTASDQLQNALTAREKLNIEKLSPRVKDLVINRVDPLLGLMRDGLTLAVELPQVAGASDEGPKTYLLLVQNEDELRPTGGFITAASSVVVQDGQLGGMDFENSGDMDNWDQPYPSAPWQLNEYMNSPVMVFRDANWFTDFPRSVLYAEYLYSYAKGHSVDGVIAFDQHMLVELLQVVGPIEVEGADQPVDANTVVPFMRESKIKTEEDLAIPGWNNKLFMNRISSALLKKILSGDVPVRKFADFIVRVLDERHLMIQLDNKEMSNLLARHNWDGAIKPVDGDFLMVVDSNIGFNKTNSVVSTKLTYSIDLTNPTTPVAQVLIEHMNSSSGLIPCGLRDRVSLDGQESYPIDRCYWDYLRIYTRGQSRLLQSNPQSIPAEWMLRGQDVFARVDTLDEDLDGISTYGLLKVVPGGQTVTTKLRYVLPMDTLSIRPGTRQVVYRLTVKKQPGTMAIPIDIEVRLPDDVALFSVPDGTQVNGNVVYYPSNLRTDLEFELVFEVP
ncbi:MAG: DUF4012 domain-containing protein [Anaerolineales bacterium]|nr:DUF4012 domain-containing protein [Anaerolineales bacterium]